MVFEIAWGCYALVGVVVVCRVREHAADKSISSGNLSLLFRGIAGFGDRYQLRTGGGAETPPIHYSHGAYTERIEYWKIRGREPDYYPPARVYWELSYHHDGVHGAGHPCYEYSQFSKRCSRNPPYHGGLYRTGIGCSHYLSDMWVSV